MNNNVKITYEQFKEVYDKIPGEPEFELYFNDRDETYMIIKYKNCASFQRCGGLERGTEEIDYSNLDELYNSNLVDDICLKNDWHLIDEIIVDGTWGLICDKEEIKQVYNVEL